MSLKYSHIKCSKCGHELGTSEQACPKCGGPVQKVCGSCGFLNSVDKKYCDSCGTMLEFRPSAGPSISVRTVVFESIGDTVNSSSFTLPKVEPKPGPGPRPDQPPSGPDSPEEGKAPSLGPRPSGPDDKSAAPPRVSGRSQKPPPAAKRSAKKLSIFSPKMLVFYLLLAVALAGLTSLFLAPHIPRIKLLLTARRYLSALSGGDYAAAYKLLSASSRESCPFEDYVRNNREYDSRVGGWEFDAPEIFMHEERAAVIKYRLKEGTGTWKDDYVSFVAENGGWARPYIWNFFGPIDEAIEKGEFAQ
ncbi:MAG TPA: zinc ribbon domain-containing protein, partial [Elusimicrobiales bacterium]|nr:zinc ribbon domain-containing protein [Elusimicrobiales bacterium]